MEIPGATNLQNLQAPEPALSPEDAELVDATRQFEAVFLRQFLGDALKPIFHATPGSEGPGAGFYQYMMTDVIANSLTQQEQFGMASLLQMQLSDQHTKMVQAEDGENAVTKGKK